MQLPNPFLTPGPGVVTKKPCHVREYAPPLTGKEYELATSGTLSHFRGNRSNHGKLGGGNFDEIIAARCARFGKHNLLNDNENVRLNLGSGRVIDGMRELRHKFIDCCTHLIGLHEPIAASAVVRSGSTANVAAIHIAREYQKRAGHDQRKYIGCSVLAHTSITSLELVKKYPVDMLTGEIIVPEEDLDTLGMFVATAGETNTGLCEWVNQGLLDYFDRHNIPQIIDGCNAATVNALPDMLPGFPGDNSPELVSHMRRMFEAPPTKFISIEPGKTVGGSEAALIAVIHTEQDPLLQKTAEQVLLCNCSEFFPGEGQYLATTVPASAAASLYLFLDTYGIRRVQYDEFIAKRSAVELADQLRQQGVLTLGANLNWVTIPFRDKERVEEARSALEALGLGQIDKSDITLKTNNDILYATEMGKPGLQSESGRSEGFYALRVVIRPGEVLTSKSFSLLLNALLAFCPKVDFNILPASTVCFNHDYLATVHEPVLKCRIGTEELRALDKFYSSTQRSSQPEDLVAGQKMRFHKGVAALSVLTLSSEIEFPALLADCLQFVEAWRDRPWPSRIMEHRRLKWISTLELVPGGMEASCNTGWYRGLTPDNKLLFSVTLGRLRDSLEECLLHLPLKDKQRSNSARVFRQELDEAIEYAVGSGAILTQDGEQYIIDRLREDIVPIPRIHWR